MYIQYKEKKQQQLSHFFFRLSSIKNLFKNDHVDRYDIDHQVILIDDDDDDDLHAMNYVDDVCEIYNDPNYHLGDDDRVVDDPVNVILNDHAGTIYLEIIWMFD